MAANNGAGVTSKGAPTSLTVEDLAEQEKALQDLCKLDREFARVELIQRMRLLLQQLSANYWYSVNPERIKERALRPLYVERQKIISRIPDFWSTVFLCPPPEIAQYIQPSDTELLTHITFFAVERLELNEPGTSGDPRSLRITFEFAPNSVIEDKKLVKELRYRHAKKGGREGFVSDPVPIKWKSRKKDVTRGLGPCVISLFEAEKAVKLQIHGEEVDAVSREGLWQNERVLQGLRMKEELGQERLPFFAWFYYRGVDLTESGGKGGDREGEESAGDDAESDDGLRDVEIYPDGYDLANFLAEHLWEDAIDIYG
jgi:Nucleosome assembly protein (NAP)